MGTLRQLKIHMRSDSELRPLLVRSSHHEVLIDLDGDKVADIALIDNNHDGDIDMIGVDVTGNGDFNLYIGDADANGIPDTVEFYEDGEDMPLAAYFGRRVEDRFIDMAELVYARIVAREIIAEELISALEEFEKRAEEEYAKAQEEEKPEEAKEEPAQAASEESAEEKSAE